MTNAARRLLAGLLAWCVLSSAAALGPTSPEIAARSYLLLDLTANGQVLAARNPEAPVEPASLTKLMTAYLVFDALRVGTIRLQDVYPVSERAWQMPGSRMFVVPGARVPVEDLLKGMIVQSGNDAAVVLAEGVAGSVERFVALMNEQAKSLGMRSTAFMNPEGLTTPGHTTTVRDLAVLATRLIQDFPQYFPFYAIQKYHYPGTPAANDRNRNLLLFRDPTVDGLKTGYTQAAGYCMIATARRPVAKGNWPQGRRLLSIVVGASSEAARANESQKLLNWGYAAFQPVRLFDANQPVVTPAVWKGKDSQVALGSTTAIVVAVPAGSQSQLATQVLRKDPLVAPIVKGQQIATLQVRSTGRNEEFQLGIPLVALHAVEEAGLLGRAWDGLRLWIR
ncbi:D-alanyl-D-alanine carboxypeptidase family protein [Candidatus Symbiobacter mobilis]|uniref:serine-type D-Ala-D-Ala carboxypeptidase n=1 Tax=Candidatus Symbiobacter mobilis CR TaxID=946483 RepID=U5N7P1_9BURK|nr:D-alanyl-D-alanine carboxypeptidase family protein [Candidatus Symbiobacter mobilis]AGX86308.1 D-alanyl-D-alanine carboxypeptidase [Candidatus Symbiobacter mobilis CR]